VAAPPAPCTRVAPTGNPRRTTGRRVTPRGSASRGGAAAAREGGSVARPSPPQLHYRLPDLTLLRSLLLLRAQAACVHTGAGEDNGIGHNQELTEISLGFHSFPGPVIFTRTFSMVGARAARRGPQQRRRSGSGPRAAGTHALHPAHPVHLSWHTHLSNQPGGASPTPYAAHPTTTALSWRRGSSSIVTRT
jgi:hypothetical protein